MALRNNAPVRKIIRGKDGKVQEPFIKCRQCGERYLTDISKIHGPDGIQFLHFIAIDQFIGVARDGPCKDHLICVNRVHCQNMKPSISCDKCG